jgi:serine protease DegQ
MKRLWLLFAQTVTVALAIWFVVTALKPGWATQLTAGLHTMRSTAGVPLREAALAPIGQAQGSYRIAAGRAMPSVVNISSQKSIRRSRNPLMDDPLFRRFFGEEQHQESRGSGVIVSADGYILTNNHVIDGADEIDVLIADGRKVAAKLVGADPDTDLAVIKVALNNLPAITLGHAEQAQVGDVVLAIGNPFGVGETTTMGIISALGRTGFGINPIENFIQTDAAINPGNSGGALVDTSGNLLGINSAIFSSSGGSLGIGFAVPVSTAKAVMEGLIKNGHIVRGSIGVTVQELTPELAETFNHQGGALIADVERGSPAARAGLHPGDIIIAVNGKPTPTTYTMLDQIAQMTPGGKANVTILRRSKEQTLSVAVVKRPRPILDADD